MEIDSTLVGRIMSQPLPTPDRQLDNLIHWFKEKVGDDHFARLDIGDHDALSAVAGTVDAMALSRLLGRAASDGLLKVSGDGKLGKLTVKAWQKKSEQTAVDTAAPRVTGETEIVKGHCPGCGPERSAEVVASYENRWDDEKAAIWAVDTFRILRCRGCQTVYIQHEHIFSEDQDYEYDPGSGEDVPVLRPQLNYWPSPARRDRPTWLYDLNDSTLRSLLDEVYGALDMDHRVLAAIGARTALDRAMVLKGATESAGFREKLEELKMHGLISEHELDRLLVLTDAGSAAAHRGWSPTPDQLFTLLEGVEAFLHHAFILGDRVEAIRDAVPRRKTTESK